MSDQHIPKKKYKKPLHIDLKIFSLRAKYTKHYIFCFILMIILLIPLFVPNHLVPPLKAAAPQVLPLQQEVTSEEIVALQQRLI
jgi:hypothetical protein